jgi:hypothetical protein
MIIDEFAKAKGIKLVRGCFIRKQIADKNIITSTMKDNDEILTITVRMDPV